MNLKVWYKYYKHNNIIKFNSIQKSENFKIFFVFNVLIIDFSITI